MDTCSPVLVLPVVLLCACSSEAPGAGVAEPPDGGPVHDAGPPDSPDSSPPDAAPPQPIADPIETSAGLITGRVEDGLHVYLGVPYAAPPVGPLRWKDPAPHEPWRGVLDATELGPACPQLESAWGSPPAAQDEDCLTINVWTPASTTADALPVLVWIHGGSFVVGSSGLPTYDGANLARRGVVVVSLNYRLGPLGFLAHPLLATESPHASSGNYGVLDQIEALRWVQQNIGRFGGDPARVSVFGHSAGGASVCALVASPRAAGLLDRALMQSGFCTGKVETTADFEPVGLEMETALGCDVADDPLACMRAKPPGEVLSAVAPGTGLEPGVKYAVLVDGYVLPDSVGHLLADGKQQHVPFTAGTSADEGSRYAASLAIQTVAAFHQLIQDRWPAHAAELDALYPVSANADVPAALGELLGDWLYVCPARRSARAMAALGVSTHLYQFRYVPHDGETSGLGSYHGAELPYVFGNLIGDADHVYGPEDEKLSAAMMDYWTRFATTGDPDGTPSSWPAYEAASDANIFLDVPTAAGAHLHETGCNAWDGISE